MDKKEGLVRSSPSKDSSLYCSVLICHLPKTLTSESVGIIILICVPEKKKNMTQGLIWKRLFWEMIVGIRVEGTEENNMEEKKTVHEFSSWT